MDPRRFLRIVLRWAPIAAVAAVGAGLLAFTFLSAQPRVYETSTTLKIGQPLSGAPLLLATLSDRLLNEYAYRATTLGTIEQVIERLGLGDVSPGDIRRQVAAQIEPGSTLLTVTGRSGTPELAVELTDAIGEQLIELGEAGRSSVNVQLLLATVEVLRQEIASTAERVAQLESATDPDVEQIATLNERYVELIGTYGSALDRLNTGGAHALEVVSPATEPDEPIEPRPILYTLLVIFSALLAVVAVAALVEYFDDTLRDARDLEEATGLLTLGSIVESAGDAKRGGDSRLTTVVSPRSTAAEEYRRLRANVESVHSGERLRTLLVTGAEPERGVSDVAANLGVAFAESGLRVMLIDGNLRNPSFHDIFGLPNNRGLSTLLQHEAAIPDQVFARTRVPNLQVITSGDVSGNPVRALGSTRLKSIIIQLQGRIDLVIVTSPPVPTVSDALLLGAELHDTLLVITRSKTRRGSVRDALDALGIAQARVLGATFFAQARGPRLWARRAPELATGSSGPAGEGLEHPSSQ